MGTHRKAAALLDRVRRRMHPVPAATPVRPLSLAEAQVLPGPAGFWRRARRSPWPLRVILVGAVEVAFAVWFGAFCWWGVEGVLAW